MSASAERGIEAEPHTAGDELWPQEVVDIVHDGRSPIGSTMAFGQAPVTRTLARHCHYAA